MQNSPEFQRKIFNVPKRYKDISWDKLTEITDREKDFAKQYVLDFPHNKKSSIYLSNKVSGAGKTGFAICLALDLVDSGKVKTYPYFISFPVLMERMRQDQGSFLDSEIFQKAVNAGFVILDDIGVEGLTASVARRYYMLLEQMWLKVIPAILTSKFTLHEVVNRALSENSIEEELMTSIASRLVGMCDEFEIENKADYRIDN